MELVSRLINFGILINRDTKSINRNKKIVMLAILFFGRKLLSGVLIASLLIKIAD